MKPTSVVFLVVAALLIIAGMITCSVARNIAEADGYLLFSDTEDGGTRRTEDFSDQPITKLELAFSDAEICIIGGAEKSYIEILNFRDGMYNLTTAGKNVKLDEITDIKSMFDLQNGFSFSGIRYFLRAKQPEGVRRVNIYLNSLATENLRVITVTAKNCTMEIQNLSAVCDITATATESLILKADGLHTSSALTVNAPVSDLTFTDTTFNAVTMDASHGFIEADNMFFQSLDIETDEGDIAITAPITLSDYNIDIGSGEGKANIGGMDRPRPYSASATAETPVGTIKFTSAKASISLKEITPAPTPGQ